jgi:hypothetical protein
LQRGNDLFLSALLAQIWSPHLAVCLFTKLQLASAPFIRAIYEWVRSIRCGLELLIIVARTRPLDLRLVSNQASISSTVLVIAFLLRARSQGTLLTKRMCIAAIAWARVGDPLIHNLDTMPQPFMVSQFEVPREAVQELLEVRAVDGLPFILLMPAGSIADDLLSTHSLCRFNCCCF